MIKIITVICKISDKLHNEGSLDSMYSVKAGYSIDTYNIPNYFEKGKKQNG